MYTEITNSEIVRYRDVQKVFGHNGGVFTFSRLTQFKCPWPLERHSRHSWLEHLSLA